MSHRGLKGGTNSYRTGAKQFPDFPLPPGPNPPAKFHAAKAAKKHNSEERRQCAPVMAMRILPNAGNGKQKENADSQGSDAKRSPGANAQEVVDAEG